MVLPEVSCTFEPMTSSVVRMMCDTFTVLQWHEEWNCKTHW